MHFPSSTTWILVFFLFLVHFWWCFFHLWKKMIRTFKFMSFRLMNRFQPFPPWLLEGFYGIWRQAHGPYVSIMQHHRWINCEVQLVQFLFFCNHGSLHTTLSIGFCTSNSPVLLQPAQHVWTSEKKITRKQTPWVRPVFLHDSSNVCWAKTCKIDDQITEQLWCIKSFRVAKVSILPFR